MIEGLAQGLYVAARVGFEAVTLRTQGTEFTMEPPRPQMNIYLHNTDITSTVTLTFCLYSMCHMLTILTSKINKYRLK